MKDIYRNPTFYYVLVPIIIALWPLFVWTVYLPAAERKWEDDKAQYEKAQTTIAQILVLDPDRLESRSANTDADKFDYTIAVDEAARECKISATNYQLRSRQVRDSKAKGKKTQSCHVVLRQVGIADFAGFLSTIQHRWAYLQCEKLSLTRIKDQPDVWKVDLDFLYYY